mgnify:CR=1 FL=1
MDFSLSAKAQNDKNSQIPPKIQSKTKIPLTKKIIPYYIFFQNKHSSKNFPPLVTKITIFHLLFSQICEILLIIGQKFAQILQIFVKFSQKSEISTRPKPHFTATLKKIPPNFTKIYKFKFRLSINLYFRAIMTLLNSIL